MACFALALPPAAVAEAWREPAREMAQKIFERAGFASDLALRASSLAELPAAESAAAAAALQRELRALGARLVEPAQAVAEVDVTLAENAAGYLWAAEVRQGAQREVVLHQFERGPAGAPPPERPLLVVQRRPVFAHDEPVLDLALLDELTGRPVLLVLHPGRVSLYGMQGGLWDLEHDILLPHSERLPRDVRGRLRMGSATSFDVYLPGLVCQGTLAATVGARCRQTDDAWPLAESSAAGLYGFFHARRNFFSAARVSTQQGDAAASSLPFFSGAIAGWGENAAAVFAAMDGQLWSGAARLGQWGSDVAAVRSQCGLGSQLLVTGQRDWTAPDTVRPLELREGEVAAAGAPLEFAGPITALWRASETEALAVARDLKTLRYEAFLLSVGCGR